MNTIYQLVNQHRLNTPQKTAITYQDQTRSYQSLLEDVDAFANGLLSIGVRRGSKLALFCGNNNEFVITLLAVAKLGAAIAPLPLTLKGKALATALTTIDCDYVIAWQHISKLLLSQSLISSKHLVTIGSKAANEHSFTELMESDIKPLLGNDEVSADDDFIYTLTSGSTGAPKPIVFSQQTKINRAFRATVDYYQLSAEDVVLVATPMYHSLAQRSVLMPLMLGASAVLLPKFSVPAWLLAVEQQQVSFLFAVASQLTALLPELDKAKLSSLRVIVSSSATLSAEDKRLLLDKLDCQFHECYGASELGVVTDFDVTGENQPLTSVGKALPFVELKVIDEQRKELPAGQVGEIVCRSSTCFKGYYNLPQQTAESLDEQGYFYTGDLGYLDEAGYLYYMGRKKEVISSGGINVYPSDIESVIKTHPLVSECVAFGVPDKKFGEMIKVVFETLDETMCIDEMELRKLCFEQLTDYQQPKYILQVERLERNKLGKLLRNNIKLAYQTPGIEL
ncbi:class I adenylate-forming enzyme family protein [Thalassotalea euphylliae]|uniref:Long-chain fatty acid--CoA ligase n=1 Tax=Thalassotalea euphylliae TaxID=1655234 RepID=A0A3E0UFD5_9GAMM|nr:class I adenylate-forming enzyme family protein [Thalassotalea euphylliae]REL34845.1 long-chain fatty acid--CoA ligase [Thalassotalea euphylliae]